MLEERRRTLLDDGLGIRESKANGEEPGTMVVLLDEFIVLDNIETPSIEPSSKASISGLLQIALLGLTIFLE